MHTAFALIFSLSVTITVAQRTSVKWYKGNTHTHSYWSDGDDFPEMIMNWYKTRGYDFISLSDHNTFATGEKWKQLPEHPFRQQRFNEYLKKFGESWVKYKTDSSGQISVQLKTINQYRPLFEEKDKFLIMQAEEISDQYQDKPVHIGAINVKDLVKPQGGKSVTDVMQRNLDEVYAQRKKTGQLMFAHINHPNFRWAIKLEDMLPLKGERFFEVYNGHAHVHNYGDSATMGMEELWDRLQISYLRDGKQLLYGLATDDSHNYHEYRVGMNNPGRGWIMVKARELTPDALITAMEKGDFYSTTGVVLSDISFVKNFLKIQVAAAKKVTYKIQFWGADTAFATVKGVLLKEVQGTSASYQLPKNTLFVRAKIISSKPK
ncbi:MAG: hypothetical protein WKF89_20225, partial [Chitinophagaceae bacterium]